MSSSESDDDINDFDDSEDDMDDGMLPDPDDTSHLTSLFSALSTGVPSVEQSSSNLVRPAFGTSSNSSSGVTGSLPIFGDAIRSYVEAPPLFQSMANRTPYYLSIDPTLNQSNTNPLASDKLFVGNINYLVTWQELRDFFNDRGFNVIRVDLPNKHNTVNPIFIRILGSFCFKTRVVIVVLDMFGLVLLISLKV